MFCMSRQVTKDKLESIANIARNNSILTITGVPEYVENGTLTISLGLKKNNKPEIIVNLNSMRAEKHELSSQLLKLSKIIGK